MLRGRGKIGGGILGKYGVGGRGGNGGKWEIWGGENFKEKCKIFVI